MSRTEASTLEQRTMAKVSWRFLPLRRASAGEGHGRGFSRVTGREVLSVVSFSHCP